MRPPAIDGAAVHAAIAAAERRTAAEIVVAVAPFFVGSVARAARRAFDRLGVARTRGRNGVLLFVVPWRRQVFVLPDAEAETRIDPSAWQAAASQVASGFANRRATDGLVTAIAQLGDVLAARFPVTADDVNELPDPIV